MEPLTEARSEAVRAARAMLGTRFAHRGRSAVGIDCVGLVLVALRAMRVEPPPIPNYPKNPESSVLLNALRGFARPVDRAAALPGDLVVMFSSGKARHLGILCGRSVIHASTDRGVVETPVRFLPSARFFAVGI
jgi:cell wall-associated NlpC family hydrolase